MNKKINLYSHYGSTNHGCEAIVRSTIKARRRKKYMLIFNESRR